MLTHLQSVRRCRRGIGLPIKRILMLAVPVFMIGQLQAAEPLTIERIYASPALIGKSPKALKLSPDSQRVTFLQGKPEDANRFDLWEYHVDSGKTRLLVDSNSLHDGEEVLSDEEKARRERMRLFGSGIVEYYWSRDGKGLLFPLNGDIYFYSLSTQKTKRLTKTDAFETDIRFSPKGNYVSYVREQNLYIQALASGKETAISTDGGGVIKNGMAEFVAQEEMGRMTGYWWSPDERKIAFTRVDESPVLEVTRNEIYADSIKLIQQRYPSTGTANVDIQLGIAGILDSGKVTHQWIDLGDEKDFYLPRVKWLPTSEELAYQWQSRNQQTLKVEKYNLSTKQTKTLLTETSDTWVNLHDDWVFLEDGEHFIWASERTGFKHLYLYHNSGKEIHPLTQGDWVVDQIEHVDQENGAVFFTGRKNTPLERHLYRVGLAGKTFSQITRREGMHNISFARDGGIYVDKFSSVEQLPQVSVHNNAGKRLTWLEKNKVNRKHPYYPYRKKAVQTEFGTLEAEDGQALYYALHKPKKLKRKHKYPVVVMVYGGPHVQRVTNSFNSKRFFVQHLIEKGFLVFQLDNRGSYNRGKAFEAPIYKHLGVAEVSDQRKGVEFLHSLPFVDQSNIGVYGHSYGGYMAQMLMYKAGDLFKAGVSGAPVTDWLLYDTHYTERYLGHPKDNAKGYEASGVFPYAEKLDGELLIYHGMADDNVLFTNATKVFKTLQDHNKRFEMMTYPGSKHSLNGQATRTHLYSTIADFFERHLLQSK